MLLHYAKQAPLKNLTHEYVKRVRKVMASTVTLETEMDVQSQPEFKPTDGKVFVHNPLSDIWHRANVHNLKDISGKCFCGWAYNVRNARCAHEVPRPLEKNSYCERCLPQLALAHNVEVSDGSSSSSSSDDK